MGSQKLKKQTEIIANYTQTIYKNNKPTANTLPKRMAVPLTLTGIKQTVRKMKTRKKQK